MAVFVVILHRDPRGLLSFPTRRSSDLDGLMTRTARDVAVNPSTRLPGTTEIEREIRRRMENGDRKSTRLNSSHVEISYAVFCLKKKMSSSFHRSVVEVGTRSRICRSMF